MSNNKQNGKTQDNSSNRVRLANEVRPGPNNTDIHVYSEYTEDRGGPVNVIEAVRGGKVVSRFVQHNGKTIESYGSDDAQSSAVYGKIAQQIGAADDICYTKPEVVAEKAHSEQDGKEGSVVEKAELSPGKTKINMSNTSKSLGLNKFIQMKSVLKKAAAARKSSNSLKNPQLPRTMERTIDYSSGTPIIKINGEPQKVSLRIPKIPKWKELYQRRQEARRKNLGGIVFSGKGGWMVKSQELMKKWHVLVDSLRGCREPLAKELKIVRPEQPRTKDEKIDAALEAQGQTEHGDLRFLAALIRQKRREYAKKIPLPNDPRIATTPIEEPKRPASRRHLVLLKAFAASLGNKKIEVANKAPTIKNVAETTIGKKPLMRGEGLVKEQPAGKILAEHFSKPPVSEAQRRAMYAAAAGHSTIGIPKKVGEEFVAADKGGKLPEKLGKGDVIDFKTKKIIEKGPNKPISEPTKAKTRAEKLDEAMRWHGQFGGGQWLREKRRSDYVSSREKGALSFPTKSRPINMMLIAKMGRQIDKELKKTEGLSAGKTAKDFTPEENLAIMRGSIMEAKEHGEGRGRQTAADHVVEHGADYYSDKGLPSLEKRLESVKKAAKPFSVSDFGSHEAPAYFPNHGQSPDICIEFARRHIRAASKYNSGEYGKGLDPGQRAASSAYHYENAKKWMGDARLTKTQSKYNNKLSKQGVALNPANMLVGGSAPRSVAPPPPPPPPMSRASLSPALPLPPPSSLGGASNSLNAAIALERSESAQTDLARPTDGMGKSSKDRPDPARVISLPNGVVFNVYFDHPNNHGLSAEDHAYAAHWHAQQSHDHMKKADFARMAFHQAQAILHANAAQGIPNKKMPLTSARGADQIIQFNEHNKLMDELSPYRLVSQLSGRVVDKDKMINFLKNRGKMAKSGRPSLTDDFQSAKYKEYDREPPSPALSAIEVSHPGYSGLIKKIIKMRHAERNGESVTEEVERPQLDKCQLDMIRKAIAKRRQND